jgi:hypothetical protein
MLVLISPISGVPQMIASCARRSVRGRHLVVVAPVVREAFTTWPKCTRPGLLGLEEGLSHGER